MMSFRCQITKLMHSSTMRPRHVVEALLKWFTNHYFYTIVAYINHNNFDLDYFVLVLDY